MPTAAANFWHWWSNNNTERKWGKGEKKGKRKEKARLLLPSGKNRHFIIRRLDTRVYYNKFLVILLGTQLGFFFRWGSSTQSGRVLKNGEDTLLEVALPGILSEFEIIFI